MVDLHIPKPSRRTTLGLVTVTALLVSGSAWAVAGQRGAGSDPARHRAVGSQKASAEGTVDGAPCKTSYQTRNGALVPPDDTTTDNAPAGSVRFTKTCPGPVIGTFTSEVVTPDASDFIHLDMRATCVAAGRQSNPCTVGNQVFAEPGHVFFETNVARTAETHAVQMVWPWLRKGTWRFQVLPGGNNAAQLSFRTFTVSAYSSR